MLAVGLAALPTIGAKSGATRLQCSQKSFEDLRLGRKFSGQTHYNIVAQINHELGYKESRPINSRLSRGSCTFWAEGEVRAERGVRACYLHILHMADTFIVQNA